MNSKNKANKMDDDSKLDTILKELREVKKNTQEKMDVIEKDVKLIKRRTGTLVENNFRQMFPEQLGNSRNIRSIYDLLSAAPIPRDDLVKATRNFAQFLYDNCTTKLINKITGKKFEKNKNDFPRAYQEILSLKNKLKEETSDEFHHKTKLAILKDLEKLLKAAGADKNDGRRLDRDAVIMFLMEEKHNLTISLILSSDRFDTVREARSLYPALEIDGLRHFDPTDAKPGIGFGISEIKSSTYGRDKAKKQLFLRLAIFDEVLHRAFPDGYGFTCPTILYAIYYDVYDDNVNFDNTQRDVTEEIGNNMGGPIRYMKPAHIQECV